VKGAGTHVTYSGPKESLPKFVVRPWRVKVIARTLIGMTSSSQSDVEAQSEDVGLAEPRSRERAGAARGT